MKIRKAMALLLAGTMVTGAFAGCSSKKDDAGSGNAGSGEEEKITATITVWSPAEDQAAEKGSWLQTACEKFNELHPNWDLTFEYGTCGEDKAGDTVTQDVSAAADVFMYANDQVTKLLDANALAEIGGSNLEYLKENTSDLLLSTVTVGDSVYGVPFTANTWYMFYNKDIFDEEDIKNLDKMLEKGVVSFPLSTAWYNGSFYLGNGCNFFGPDGTDNDAGFDLDGEKASDVTNYLVDLVANKNFVNDADSAGKTGLINGTVGAMFSGSWDYEDLKKELGDKLGVAACPTYTLNGEEKQILSFAGSKAIGVNTNTKYPQVAVALAMYLGGEEGQKTHYEARNIIPCNTTLLKDATISADECTVAQNATTDGKSIIQPTVSNMSKWWTASANFGTLLVSGSITHDNAADETAKLNTELNESGL